MPAPYIHHSQLSTLCLQVAHSIVSVCYPGSFKSSTLLAVAVWIHRNYADRGLIDILNTLGFSDGYIEVQRLNTVFVTKGDIDYRQQKFTQLPNTVESKKGILWISYISNVHLFGLFIFAKFTGHCELCLFFIIQMIPLVHAAGQLVCAKSVHIYICTKWHIFKNLCEDEKFIEEGYFTIRKTGNFWCGNFLDQTIEWEMMCTPLKINWRNDIWLGHRW